MGKALYRKYRSRSLGEIVGQEHIVTTLTNALKEGKIGHAYLLTGPRGTGKTSIARILAHEINKLPYSEDPNFDIIEIDAASNNSVEDIRDLREKVQSAPASAKYKVYIIDEVHMLSKSAFNALLKTLEEPPEHVVFILATTEVHKLPETIMSRMQRFSFRPVPLNKVVEHLRSIASKEKIDIDNDALQLIAEHGEGSFRDSISLLDQASNLSGKITMREIEELLGRAPSRLVEELLGQVAEGNAAGIIKNLNELTNQGFESSMIAMQIGKRLREDLSAGKTAEATFGTLNLLKDLLDIPASHNAKQLLEIVLLSHATNPHGKKTDSVSAVDTKAAEVANSTSDTKTGTDKKSSSILPAEPKNVQSQTESALNTEITSSTENNKPLYPAIGKLSDNSQSQSDSIEKKAETSPDIEEVWKEVLQIIKKSHNTLYGIARMAKPSMQGDQLLLTTRFPFHQKRLNEAKNRDILANCITSTRGCKTSVTCVLSEGTTSDGDAAKSPETAFTAIANVFGGVELIN